MKIRVFTLLFSLGFQIVGQQGKSPARIYGVIVDSRGTPISGARVTVGKDTTRSLNDGSYSVKTTKTGLIEIKASRNGYEDQTKSLKVAGDDLRVDFTDFRKTKSESILNSLGFPVTQVTKKGTNSFASASINGILVVEVVDRSTKGYDLWLLDRTGKKIEVFSDKDDDETNPAWSPEGDAIAFSSYSQKNGYRILMKKLGEKEARLLDNGVTPSWSPDGKWIVYAKSSKPGTWEIWKKKVEGGEAIKLTDDHMISQSPSWGRIKDSDKIVYTSTKGTDGYYRLWTMNPDGSEQKQITDVNRDFGLIGPSLSPDGKKIVCWSNPRKGEYATWIMDSDGASFNMLIENSMNPRWLDSKTVLVASKASGRLQIWETMIDKE